MTSKLYEKGANRRIFNIDTHIGMAAAGLVTDARQLASIARDEVRIKCDQSFKQQIVTCELLQASSYRQGYGSSVPLPQLIQKCPATCTPTHSTAASGTVKGDLKLVCFEYLLQYEYVLSGQG